MFGSDVTLQDFCFLYRRLFNGCHRRVPGRYTAPSGCNVLELRFDRRFQLMSFLNTEATSTEGRLRRLFVPDTTERSV